MCFFDEVSELFLKYAYEHCMIETVNEGTGGSKLHVGSVGERVATVEQFLSTSR